MYSCIITFSKLAILQGSIVPYEPLRYIMKIAFTISMGMHIDIDLTWLHVWRHQVVQPTWTIRESW